MEGLPEGEGAMSRVSVSAHSGIGSGGKIQGKFKKKGSY